MKIDIIGIFERFYLKFPPLGEDLKRFIIQILPLFALIAGVLITVGAVIDFLGTPIFSAFTLGGGIDLVRQLLLIDAIAVVLGILMIFSYPSLRGHHQRGWRLLFWAQILWALSGVITFSPSLLLAIVLFYPLFQVKSYYK